MKNLTPRGVKVKVGQIWTNFDHWRGSQLEILKITKKNGFPAVLVKDVRGGIRRKILIRRLVPNSTGYKLIE